MGNLVEAQRHDPSRIQEYADPVQRVGGCRVPAQRGDCACDSNAPRRRQQFHARNRGRHAHAALSDVRVHSLLRAAERRHQHGCMDSRLHFTDHLPRRVFRRDSARRVGDIVDGSAGVRARARFQEPWHVPAYPAAAACAAHRTGARQPAHHLLKRYSLSVDHHGARTYVRGCVGAVAIFHPV